MAGTRTPSCIALCMGAMLGPIAGLVVAPFAFLGAACALMSIVLACVSVHEGRAEPAARMTDRA
jgi:hypothetical protein